MATNAQKAAVLQELYDLTSKVLMDFRRDVRKVLEEIQWGNTGPLSNCCPCCDRHQFPDLDLGPEPRQGKHAWDCMLAILAELPREDPPAPPDPNACTCGEMRSANHYPGCPAWGVDTRKP